MFLKAPVFTRVDGEHLLKETVTVAPILHPLLYSHPGYVTLQLLPSKG